MKRDFYTIRGKVKFFTLFEFDKKVYVSFISTQCVNTNGVGLVPPVDILRQPGGLVNTRLGQMADAISSRGFDACRPQQCRC